MKGPRKVLFIGPVFPEPTSSAAGVRTRSLLEDFRSRGDTILFASASDQNAFSEALTERGIQTVKIGPNDPEFDRIVGEFAPDVVLFDRFMLEEQFGWRVAEVAPGALRILDTIDLHFLRRIRGEWLKAALSSEGASIPDAELARIATSLEGIETADCLREMASIYRSDLTLVLSRFETDLLKDRFRIDESLVQFLGFSYPPIDRSADLPFQRRKHFASIGNFRHLPNRDATFWLARRLWPEMRARLAELGEKDVELHLYGAYPPKEIMALDSPATGFRVFGPTPDALAILRGYRVCVAPLRFGAGIKGKIADAWAAGIPVVTTPIGAEGMSIRDEGAEFAGVVATTEVGFIAEAAALYRDESRSKRYADLGRASLEAIYSEEKNRAAFLSRIDQLLAPEALASHRSKNTVGRILNQEAYGRTKYLSKWIEEKNR